MPRREPRKPLPGFIRAPKIDLSCKKFAAHFAFQLASSSLSAYWPASLIPRTYTCGFPFGTRSPVFQPIARQPQDQNPGKTRLVRVNPNSIHRCGYSPVGSLHDFGLVKYQVSSATRRKLSGQVYLQGASWALPLLAWDRSHAAGCLVRVATWGTAWAAPMNSLQVVNKKF